MANSGKHLGDFVLVQEKFPEIENVIKNFKGKEFASLNEKQKRHRINHSLYQLIHEAKEPCFLLSSVLNFIERIVNEKLLESYHFSQFELWLNQFSEISHDDNMHIRAKIIGKRVPREEYQILFPIGMGKSYPGTHFVTAHSSPDIDTTIASFWGWADAFGAKVSDGLHLWNVPGGAPAVEVEVEQLFYQPLGRGVFDLLAKDHHSLLLSSLDLVSQKGVIEKDQESSMDSIDHERNQNAIILVDDKGYYLGDWRNFDVEGVRQVIELLHICLRWFESHLYAELVSLFSKAKVSKADFESLVHNILDIPLKESDPVKRFSSKQKKLLDNYLRLVLKAEKGIDSTFTEFADAIKAISLNSFASFADFLRSLKSSDLFESGALSENRPVLFQKLHKVIQDLRLAMQKIDAYVDRLGVSLDIKTQVFGYPAQSVSYRADIDEIRAKMGNYSYLTVTYSDKEGKLMPVGVVHAQDLYKPVLGTVSLRDFCNREETKIPSYLDIISVVDHHKTNFITSTPPVAHISDSQSSNAIVAELAFAINDRYSTGGMSAASIQEQIKEVQKDLSNPSSKRLMRRLLNRQMHSDNAGSFFIDPKREFFEYLQFVYAILDDTDLLTKISMRDVITMASLLNRLKSLMLGKEVEIVHFDDIPKNNNFVQVAAKRILQNLDMYSLCRRIYLAKEEVVEENLKQCAKGQPSNFFSDTKEQNGCCRIGQAKLYARNFTVYEKYADSLRDMWSQHAAKLSVAKKEVDFHLQMISTIAGAEDLYAGSSNEYKHQDEIWIYIPWTEQSISHLKSFLNGFQTLSLVSKIGMNAEFMGKHAEGLEQIFKESFLPIPHKISKKEGNSLVVLRFKAGAINSRKAMISPYLPKLVS